MRYYPYSEYLKQVYGEKVYKLPINLPLSCPNRDGAKGFGGCTFCGEKGTGFENLSDRLSVSQQLQANMEYIGKRYGAKKFIAYFQNYTNTYADLETFRGYMKDASSMDSVVEICVSTRPDCISDAYLEVLQQVAADANVRISLELGLQTVNYHTLKAINRGHTLAEFIDAAIRCKAAGMQICAHMILNLPGDDDLDAIEGAKILTALGVDQVKLHSLYIEKGTKLCRQYEADQLKMLPVEEYINRVIAFLEHIRPDVPVQRLVSRAPEEETVFCNWSIGWWKLRDMIERTLAERNTRQGAKCNYLNLDYEKLNP